MNARIRMLGLSLLLMLGSGCALLHTESLEGNRAELVIDGDAPYVELEYVMVDSERRANPGDVKAAVHLGNHPQPYPLPYSRSFAVYDKDELQVRCSLPGTNESATVRLLVDDEEIRTYTLTPLRTQIFFQHEF